MFAAVGSTCSVDDPPEVVEVDDEEEPSSIPTMEKTLQPASSAHATTSLAALRAYFLEMFDLPERRPKIFTGSQPQYD
jgi:hypothetical protein